MPLPKTVSQSATCRLSACERRPPARRKATFCIAKDISLSVNNISHPPSVLISPQNIYTQTLDAEKRRAEISEYKAEYGLDFDLFLLPNNQSAGALEDLLENIINPNNQPIFDCWNDYEEDLRQVTITGRDKPLTTIAKLQGLGLLKREGGRKTGVWVVINKTKENEQPIE